MNITLKDVNEENFIECIDLEVNEKQKAYVAPNVFSIAESKIYPEVTIKTIYNDTTLIGFLMFGRNNEKDDTYPWLIRFMIDQRYQGKGYGKKALALTLKLMEETYPNEPMFLSTSPENIDAIRFYEKFGFMSTGRIQYDELVFKKDTN